MNLLDLFVKIGVDDQASSKIGGIASGITSKLGGAVKAVGKAVTVAGAAAGAGAIAIAKSAVDSYKNYEQLVGGVNKLYGDASDKLQEYAQNAYKTSGMSANDYMQQATSFSAALINSLGGDVDKAAEQTDKAMRMMSDNINTFGSDAESVQNAIQGLSRENYTMIDNLRLGYAGSKEGMKSLIKDAEKYAKQVKKMGFKEYAESMKDTGLSADELRKRYDELSNSTDLTIGNFSDMVDAIDIIQEKQNILGTTSKEALSTIEGSAASAKASWENLLTAIGAGDSDMVQKSVSGLVTSLFGTWDDEVQKKTGGLINNLIPVLQNVADALSQQIPSIAESLVFQFVQAIGAQLGIETSVVDDFMTDLEGKFESARQALSDFWGAFTSNADTSGVVELFKLFGDALGAVFTFLTDNAGTIGSTAADIVDAFNQIVGAIRPMVESFQEKFDDTGFREAFENIKTIVSDAWTFFNDNILANKDQIGEFLGTIATFVGTVADKATELFIVLEPYLPFIAALLVAFNGVLPIVTAVAGAFTFVTGTLIPAITAIQSVGGAVTALVGILGGPITIIAAIIAAIIAFVATNEDARNAVIAAVTAVVEFFSTLPETFAAIWEAIKAKFHELVDDVKERWATWAQETAEWNENMRQTILEKWEAIKAAISNAIAKAKEAVSNKVSEILEKMRNLPQDILNALGDLGSLLWNAGRDVIDGFLGGLKEKWESAKGWFENITSSIPKIKGPKQRDLHLLTQNGRWIMQGLNEGLIDGYSQVQSTLAGITDGISTGINASVSVRTATPTNDPVLAMLAEIRDNIGSDIYLDGKTLVGGTAPLMNRAIARL